MSSDKKVTAGSGNVFADLGFEQAIKPPFLNA